MSRAEIASVIALKSSKYFLSIGIFLSSVVGCPKALMLYHMKSENTVESRRRQRKTGAASEETAPVEFS